jgi:cytochrome c-type biogenesis protein CcmH
MKRLLALIVALAACCALHAKEAVPLADDPAVEQRLIVISEEMRCLVCQNESLAGSRSELANDLRVQIREQIRQGKTDEQIREYMVARYGDFVLYRPPVKPMTWLLWIGPFLILAGAVAVLFHHLRANARRTDEEEATT